MRGQSESFSGEWIEVRKNDFSRPILFLSILYYFVKKSYIFFLSILYYFVLPKYRIGVSQQRDSEVLEGLPVHWRMLV